MQHIQIAESHNDRMSVAEDPFTRVVEQGHGDIETSEYYIKNERMKTTNNFKADDVYCNRPKTMVLIRYQIFNQISINLQRG